MIQPSGYRVDFQGSNLLDVDHAAYRRNTPMSPTSGGRLFNSFREHS
jgi:hypothetical protein